MTLLTPPVMPGLRLERDVPLGPRTTWKVGGAVDLLATVDQPAALGPLLAWLGESGTPHFVLGNGSNLLVSDTGFRGCAVLLGEGFRQVAVSPPDALGQATVTAGGAVSITRLLRAARAASVLGLEVLGGVPGTVGGAVAMNAGTRYGDVAQILGTATICTAQGDLTHPAADLGLRYRHAALPAGGVVTEAAFRVTVTSDPDALGVYEAVLAYRKATQPLQAPSCGSVFANPPGDAAGRLIEAVGLKGERVGGACVSLQHANWILNEGHATAADVSRLMARVQTAVADRFGVTLRPEVRVVGDLPVALAGAVHVGVPRAGGAS
jgi:UDP-N-acetylmuramate dehydrogenase